MNYAKINKIFAELLDDVEYIKRKTYIIQKNEKNKTK